MAKWSTTVPSHFSRKFYTHDHEIVYSIHRPLEWVSGQTDNFYGERGAYSVVLALGKGSSGAMDLCTESEIREVGARASVLGLREGEFRLEWPM